VKDGVSVTDAVAVAHLRCNIPAAIELRAALDSALLLAAKVGVRRTEYSDGGRNAAASIASGHALYRRGCFIPLCRHLGIVERWNRCRQLKHFALWQLAGTSQPARKFASPSSRPFWVERSRRVANSTMASQFEFQQAIEALQNAKAGKPRL
jgi:hypothetical protein